MTPPLRTDLAVGAAAGVLAVLLRLPSLATPSTFVFDEIFYADDAFLMVSEGAEPASVAHPPLGKVLLALGIRVLGFTPTGWRAASFLCGLATVVVVTVLARRLSGSAPIGLAAGAVVTVDGTAFTMGRLAMLDGLVMLPLILGIGILAVALHEGRQVSPARAAAAGAVLGAGCAVKWSTLPVLVVAGLVVLWQARRRQAMTGAGALGGAVIVTGLVVYAASYTTHAVTPPPDLTCAPAEQCEPGFADRVAAPATETLRMVRFHRDLEVKNSYAGPIWRWWSAPTTLWEEPCLPDNPSPSCSDAAPGTVARIQSVPSLVTALVTLVWAVATFARRHRPDAATVLLAASLAALLLPWVPGGRPGYSYYLAGAVPVAVTLAASGIRPAGPTAQRIIAGLVVACALGLFLLQRPLLVGLAR